MKTQYIMVFAALLMICWVAACSHMAYYGQAIRGHFDLMMRREPIEAILSDSSRDTELLAQLKLAREIRDFASQELNLPDNGSYRSYVDLGQRYVTWVVYAAPEFSLSPKLWCFPVAGCVPYRGFFSERDALVESQKLKVSGMDTHVSGVAAYSTLGWFDDPLINTMFSRGETTLAGLIFHELAHQRLYVDDDTEFNEAFAVAVQQTGVRRWLKQRRSEQDLEAFEQALLRQQEFYALVTEIKQELGAVYDSTLSDGGKRRTKRKVVASARLRYDGLKKKWQGYTGYDAWFDVPINNAKLAATVVYLDKVPAFIRLLEACDRNYVLFYSHLERIAALPRDIRQAQLEHGEDCGASGI